VRKRAQRGRAIRVSTVGAVAVALSAAAFATFAPGSSRDRLGTADSAASGDPVSRTAILDGVTWTVTRSESAAGPCVGVIASQRASTLGEVGGGCGTSDGPIRWGLGGLREGNTQYTVAYGVAVGATSVQVAQREGGTLSDTRVDPRNGLWIVVSARDVTTNPADFTDAWVTDDTGQLIAHVSLPSIAGARQDSHRPVGRAN
jgi:hypothetical protein